MRLIQGAAIFGAILTAVFFAFESEVVLTPTENSHDKLRVGVSLPLTGELAEYGSAVRNGIELAVSESPKDFTELSFYYEDNKYEATMAVSAFNKLRTINRVDLIYNWGEPTLNAIAPLAERARLPVLAMSLDPKPSLGREYIIRSINYAEQYSQIMLGYLRSKGLKQFAFVKTEDPFLNAMLEGLRRHLGPGERIINVYSVLPEQTDFKTLIAKIKLQGIDALGVYLFSGQVSAFYRQARAQNFTVPTFGTDFFESKTEISEADGGMEGAVYPNIAVDAGFHSRYLARFGNDIQIAYAYNAYESARVLAEVSRKMAGSWSSKDIIKELKIQGVNSERFSYREDGLGGKYYQFPLVIKQVRGGNAFTIS